MNTYSRDAIVDIFYERHLDELLDVITSSYPPNGAVPAAYNSISSNGNFGNEIRAKPEILLNIYDLLCFCVLQHPYKIKSKFLLSGVIDKVLSLTCRREKYLVVAAIRFFRTLISLKDEHLMNHIAKNNLFKPIVDVFVGNGSRSNLLNSAVLELFEYIRKENLKILLKYLVERFWDQFVKFDSLPSIQSLKVRYEQAMEQATNQTGPYALNARRRVDERALEKEEEDYFNEDSPRPGGLLDYEDDGDDKDNKPPPLNKPEKSEEDEGTLELRLKKKLSASKQEPKMVKKQRLGGEENPTSKETVFATLCSTLSQAVLPSKKTTIATNAPNNQDTNMGPIEKHPKVKSDTSPDQEKEADGGDVTVATEMAINGS